MARSGPADGSGAGTAPRKRAAKSGSGRSTSPRASATRRAAAAAPPLDQNRGGSSALIGGLGGLLRGSGSMLGQISGLDSPARSLERLALAAERGALLLDRIEREVGLDQVVAMLERLDHAVTLLERIDTSLEATRRDGQTMRISLAEIEERVVDLHARIAPPLDRLPLTRGRRHRTGGPPKH